MTTRIAMLCLGLGTAAACSKHEVPATDTTVALAPAPASESASPATPAASASPSIRGTISAVTDSTLTVSTATGAMRVRIAPPLHVFARTSSDLAHVTPNAFVGITSVAQPDGSERATEIHIFPEELRGTGEGSRLMMESAGTKGRSTMTNGTVAAPRMTNGTVNAAAAGSVVTVTYAGGSQRIAIPAGVSVTAITPSAAKLAPGAAVVVLATRGADSTLSTSTVMLAGPTTAPR